ncbi:MAG: response regulator transcription factor [Betaproteobacteria bacterium]|nr:MAG: response regulator transcription factor [Betaproteobacteria bacterium]
MRILVADDHAVVRRGLRHILETTPDLAIADEAASGTEVMEKLQAGEFEVLLMDVSMPGTDPVDLIKRVKAQHPRVAVLVHSMHAEGPVASRMLKAGASGYITKDSEPEQLLAALRKVAAGGRYIGAALAEQLAFGNGAAKPLHELLSDRESQVFFLLASGKTLKAIARELHLSPKTASTYKTRIMQKLNLQSDADLIRYALANQLVK